MKNNFNRLWNYKTLFWLLVFIRAYFNAVLPLMDQTEARYAEIARLMVETQNWVMLQIDYGVPFLAKPPLSTWAAALSIFIFGTHAFFVRLPYFLVQVGLAMGVQKAISQEKVPPYLASIILFTLPEFYLHSGVVSTDVFLHLSIVLVMASFWQWQKTKKNRLWGLLLFVGLGLGLLAKGPIIILLTAPPLFLWTVFQKQFWKTLKNLPWFSGIPLMLLIALPWYVAAEKASPGFIDYFIIGEHFKRFFDSTWAGDRYGFPKQQPLGIVWLFLVGATLPWGIIALRHIITSFKSLRQQPWLLFLVCWLLWTPFFFTFSKSLIHPYTLPVMLPVALLVLEAWPFIKAKTTYIGIATVVPLLLFIAHLSGAGQQLIKNSTDKFILPKETEKTIYAFPKKSYSSQYYTAGKIKTISAAQLEKEKSNDAPFYVLVEKKKRTQIDTLGMQFVKENKKKRLYIFEPLGK